MQQLHIDDIADEWRAIGHALQRLVELRPVLGLDERLAALVADDPRAMSAVANIIAAVDLIAKGLPPAERAAIARHLREVAEELDHHATH